MPIIMRSSFLRVLLITTFAGVCLCSQASAQTSHKYRVLLEAASGTFAGESICVGNRPDCKTEKVISVIEPAGRNAEDILLTLDFTHGGARVPGFRQKLHYDQKINYFDGRFLTARDFTRDTSAGTTAGTTFTYTITITNSGPNILEGTITLADTNTVVRRLKLKRVKPDQVPPAPSASMYQSR